VDRQPFRFAVQATNAASAREWRELVCKIEELGYSSLMLADHYLGPGTAQVAARTPRQDLAPIAAIATAAAHTSSLRVGCRVFCIDYHAPAALAKEVATLDLLSDGRLECVVKRRGAPLPSHRPARPRGPPRIRRPDPTSGAGG
jgi:alkanesulfonate monooxygenase SsuD/methylene tetrahydromethanopterin reductase-like flavin-dependent oxidoreductase (luciferase family)